ncbi:hypothetical protein [Xenorhabdus sp. IM139775]|uniref:hypothetical protein n=1 Tax=Xenorhabdus sp. IM139775 TaxID=3025876 RepID=UPI002359D7FA|nr:hypothetical protein [Xenorhabdus sp. IM139775]MDC9593878.1 hypothetical protein [Xenorhabdus sp. IM139775]
MCSSISGLMFALAPAWRGKSGVLSPAVLEETPVSLTCFCRVNQAGTLCSGYGVVFWYSGKVCDLRQPREREPLSP